MSLGDFSALLPVAGTLVIAAAVYSLLKWSAQSRKLPPGPFLPVLDMTMGTKSASKDPSVFLRWNKNWGEVTSFRFAHVLFVVANTSASISQMLLKNAESSSGRFHGPFKHPMFDFRKGIIQADGDEWKQRRSFILNMFRQFGFSKYETPIARECQYLIEQFKNFDGKVFNPLLPINSAVSNIIYQLLFGERMDRKEMKEFEKIISRVNDLMTDEIINNSLLAQLIRGAASYLPGDIFHIKHMQKGLNAIGEYVQNHMNQQKAIQSCGEPSGLLDACLRDNKFTDIEIRSILLDLLLAGMETTTTTLRWSLLLMAKYPDVQHKVREEIREHLEGKAPTYNDRSVLVYTEAVIHEVERFVTILPLSVPHVSTSDFTLNGYLIPKGAFLLPNLYAAHHDEKVWPYANTFNPANFYDESEKRLKNLENLIPFSVGRRSCLGETLAKQELFVFFTCLLQNFEISESEGQPLPPLDESVIAIVRSPKPYSIIAKFVA